VGLTVIYRETAASGLSRLREEDKAVFARARSAIRALAGRVFGAAQAAMLFAITHETGEAHDTIEPLLTSAAGQAEEYLQRRARPSSWNCALCAARR
jgi:hypothetical protein